MPERAPRMDDRSDSALVALRRILRAVELNSRELARQSGLTTSQLIVLQFVVRGGQVTPSSLAQSVSLTQATVTSLVDKLERRGFVTRSRDTADRRRVWIEATEPGRAAAATAPGLLQDRFETRFNKLKDWEQAMVVTALERISALLDADDIDASPVLDVGDIDRLPAAGGEEPHPRDPADRGPAGKGRPTIRRL